MTPTGGNGRRPGGAGPVVRPALRRLARNFFEHDIGKSAAALAYYLLFALFPMLIFFNNVLGLLDLDVAAITAALLRFLPRDVVGLAENYLDHLAHTSSHSLLWFSLVFSIWFPMRAAKGLMDDVRLAYGLKKPGNPLTYRVRQLAYTVVLLLVIALTLLFSTLGQHVLGYLFRLLPAGTLPGLDYLLAVWQYLRFLPAGLLMFAALGSLYALSLDSRQPVRTILPGIVAALAAWMAVSVGFSFYVENFANYSVVYGTLGAVIVLLMWLYMTAMILILGAELNAALAAVRGGQG